MQVARPMALQYADFVIDEARGRADSLDALIARLAAFGEDSSRPEFTELFRDAALILELMDDDLARLFKISRPTASRWRSGDSAPHPVGRKAVFDVLGHEAKRKRRAIDGRF